MTRRRFTLLLSLVTWLPAQASIAQTPGPATPQPIREISEGVDFAAAERRRAERLRLNPVAASVPKADSGACNSALRNTSMVVGSAVGGWVGGFGGFLAFDDPSGTDRRFRGDAGYTPAANRAFVAGSFVGSALASALVNKHACRRFKRAFVGAAIPTLLMVGKLDEPYLPLIGAVYVVPLQSIGAFVAQRVKGSTEK